MVCSSQVTCRSRFSPSTRWSGVVYSLTFLFRVSLVFLAGVKDKLVHFFTSEQSEMGVLLDC